MTAEEKVKAVIEYCESRLKKDKSRHNGPDWAAGYKYVLDRILGIAKTGKIYEECSEEERRKEEIIYLKKRIKEQQFVLQGMRDKIPEKENYIEELKERLAELKKK
jgi:hypothetical protein